MASIDSKRLPFPLTSELAQILGLAAKRGYSNGALWALALDYQASRYQLERFGNYRPQKPLTNALANAVLKQG